MFGLNEQFAVVYSWGVHHHAANVALAVQKAGDAVKPGGHLALALYAKTPLWGFWRVEKRVNRKLPRPIQKIAQYGFASAGAELRFITGRKTTKVKTRGMDRMRDIHDWLGGYPYEPANFADTLAMLPGFELVRTTTLYDPEAMGVLGSGCEEYVLRRHS